MVADMTNLLRRSIANGPDKPGYDDGAMVALVTPTTTFPAAEVDGDCIDKWVFD